MHDSKNLTDSLTKFVLFAVSVGFLCFFLNSCAISLRDAHTPHETITNKDKIDAQSLQTDNPHSPDMPHDELFHPNDKIQQEEILMKYQRRISDEALEWAEQYDRLYGEGASDKIILTTEEIDELNRRMISDCPTMRDMSDFVETLSGSELRKMIEKYSLPSGERYIGGQTLITSAMLDDVSHNRNLDGIAETVKIKRAVVVKRCDLKSFPTDTTFHKHGDKHYDDIQETELISGFPVMVAHTSYNKQFVFVLSYFYNGWIPSDCIAYCTDEEYQMFAAPENYVTVIAKSVECGGSKYDMGAKLPYLSESEDSFNIQIPKRDRNGILYLQEAKISKSDAVYGTLAYTMKNYYAQAFAFLGTYYGWGGSNGGVDCSGFVCAVFRSFGIYLPRNTGEQSKYAGEVTPFNENPVPVLDEVSLPAAIYKPGHVMLYLGKKDGIYYIIHAPQGGEQVCTASLSVPGNLTSVSIIK